MSELRVLFVIGLIGCFASPLSADVRATPPAKINVSKVKNVPKQRIYIRCDGASEAETIAFRRRLFDLGAEKVNFFVPSLIVCEVPLAVDPAQMIDDPRFSYVEESRLDDGTATGVGEEVRRVRQSYALARALASDEVPPPAIDDFEDRVLMVPPEIVERSRRFPGSRSSEATLERSIVQNAEFLIGDVLIRLVFPESRPGGEGNEQWTNDELRNATQGAATAALAFQQRYAYLPMSFVFTSEERVDTGYEPIKHNMNDDGTTWIPDVMNTLGYSGLKDVRLVVHDYNNDGRKRFGTDWVYTAFIANSRNEPGHIFSGGVGGAGYTAYANLGGPYLVIPYPAGANDPNNVGELLLYSQIFQHEMVHIFWGLDEYPSALSQCDSHMGYLDYPNLNKVTDALGGGLVGCPTYTECLMWNARASADVGRALCFYTAGQLGVVDANSNGIPDVFDRPPTVVFEGALVETVLAPSINLVMKAISQAVPNENPFQAPAERVNYAAPLKDATIDVDGIGGSRVDPEDGRWNEVEEDLTFAIQGLNTGLTRIDVTVRNTFGATSPKIQKKVYFIGVKFGLVDLDVKPQGIMVSWQTVGETFAAQLDLYRIVYANGRTDTLKVAENVQSTGNPGDLFMPYSHFDTDVEPGHEYQYFISGHFELEVQGENRRFETVSNAFAVRAMLPMSAGGRVSFVAPNPFNETTSISIDVPKTFAQKDVDDGSPRVTGIREEIPTEIAVTVYDVQGRLVKKIFNGKMFSQVETFSWDGTNSRNARVPSGIYFVRALAGSVQEVRKVVLVR